MYIGVDLGGTNIKYGQVSAQGELRELRSKPTQSHEGPERVIQRIGDCIEELLGENDDPNQVRGIGIGTPGPLDFSSGIVYEAPNLNGWKNIPLRDHIQNRFQLPTIIENDANVAVFGEWMSGSGQGSRNMLGITLGTGVGGGIIIDGQLYRGTNGTAGEFGHMTLFPNGLLCGCGNHGCLEMYASGSALVRLAREAIETDSTTMLTKMIEGDVTRLTAHLVHIAMQNGDALATHLIHTLAENLGIAIASLINVFNPEIISLSGGVANAGEDLFGPLRDVVKKRAFQRPVEHVRIVQAQLVGEAGVIGAAGLAKQYCQGSAAA